MLADNTQRTTLLPYTSSGLLACALGIASPVVAGGFMIDPFYADHYEAVDLGSVPGVPGNYGGLTFKAGDPDTLLIGGGLASPGSAIYEVQVTRGCFGQITGFAGKATFLASAPQIDGGLDYGPDGVLFYTTWPTNTVGQILPGSTEPDKIIDLSALGVVGITGTLAFVPPGFAGASRLKIGTFTTSLWYDATVTPDGAGTFDIIDVTEITNVGGGPEGIVYIDQGNPQFEADSVLVSKWFADSVDSYEIDVNGDPVISTQRNFISGLDSPGGATIDPITGEVLISTWYADRVIVVRGFVDPCPGDLDEDGTVGISDLLALLSAWGAACVPADLDRDGTVDIFDLLTLIANWGPCP